MRLLVSALLLICLACSREPDPVASVGTIVAPASPPRVYTRFSDIAPLFEQRNDTTYLINFWATWCKPCLEELPLLEALREETTDEPLVIVLVSLDDDPEKIADIPAYLERQRLGLPTVVLTDDGGDWQRELDEHWNGALPTTFIYRNELRYVFRRPFMTLPDLRSAVGPLLGR